MGANCCAESKMDGSTTAPQVNQGGQPEPQAAPAPVIVQKDLAAISMDGKDTYEKFELSLPFCRTKITTFAPSLLEAEKKSGEGYVTINALTKIFNTPAWAQLTQDDSKLCKILLSEPFRHKESGV